VLTIRFQPATSLRESLAAATGESHSWAAILWYAVEWVLSSRLISESWLVTKGTKSLEHIHCTHLHVIRTYQYIVSLTKLRLFIHLSFEIVPNSYRGNSVVGHTVQLRIGGYSCVQQFRDSFEWHCWVGKLPNLVQSRETGHLGVGHTVQYSGWRYQLTRKINLPTESWKGPVLSIHIFKTSHD